jgi:hygromycin-B 7''-O-kinase
MCGLPQVRDAAALYELIGDPARWKAAIDLIRGRHGLGDGFAPSRDGSTVVYLSPRWCIKLSPPLTAFRAGHDRELQYLQSIEGQLPIPTPQLVAKGTVEDWSYFVSTRLRGVAIDSLWANLDAPARTRIAARLGEALRALHGLESGALQESADRWADFRASQRSTCLDTEVRKGLQPTRLAELEEYLRKLDSIPEPSFDPAILHTEIGPAHVLVEDGEITGLIDFGDAMVGDPEYDLAPVGLFVTAGDAVAFRAFCTSYGLDAEALSDPARPHRLLRHALLHRYGTLTWYLQRLAPPVHALPDLAGHWFATA